MPNQKPFATYVISESETIKRSKRVVLRSIINRRESKRSELFFFSA